MTVRRDIVIYASFAAVLMTALIALFFLGPRWLSTPPPVVQTSAAAPSEARKIRARLFYVDPDGQHLMEVEEEVPYGEGTTEQAKRIIEASLAAPAAPYVSVAGSRGAIRQRVSSL